MSKINGTYMVGTFLYGVSRKIPQLYDAKVEIRDYNYRPRIESMLVIDKLAISAISGICAPIYWPIYLYLDFRRFETRLRGLPVSQPTELLGHLLR